MSGEDVPDRSVANHLGRDPHLSRERLSHASGDLLRRIVDVSMTAFMVNSSKVSHPCVVFIEQDLDALDFSLAEGSVDRPLDVEDLVGLKVAHISLEHQ